MSRCPECGCALPGTETLCRECYSVSYALVGQPKRSKSFRERLTRRNVLFFLGIFAYGFLVCRFQISRFFFVGHYYAPMPTKLAILTAFVLSSFAFYVESSRQK